MANLIASFRSAKASNGISVHVCRTDRFKTIYLQLWLGRELDERATHASLLSSVLRQGCKAYPDMRAIGAALENLYGSAFNCSVMKAGGRQVMRLRMEMPAPAYLPRRVDMLNRGVRFLKEILLRPLVDDGRFVPAIVAREKSNLAAYILSLMNDKMSYAVQRCLEEMCRTERIRFYEHGDIQTLEAITPEGLCGFFRDFISSAPADVFVVGDVSLERVLHEVEKHLAFPRKGGAAFLPPEKVSAPKRPRRVVERQAVEQAKLCLGMRTRTLLSDSDYPAATVFNGVLGAFPHSRLFRTIREGSGLAYEVDSSLEGSRGLMMISMGIDAAKYRRAFEIVLKQLREIRAAKMTREELGSTKKRIASQLLGIPDSPSRLISFYYSQRTNGGSADLKEWVRRVAAVRAADVAAVARKTTLDTIYFLRPPSGRHKF